MFKQRICTAVIRFYISQFPKPYRSFRSNFQAMNTKVVDFENVFGHFYKIIRKIVIFVVL